MNRYWQKLKNQKGVTFVEILISVFILSVGITGSLAYFTTAQAATRLSRYKTTATAHAEYILEEMSALPTIASITRINSYDPIIDPNPDQTYWDAFVAAQSLNTLENEDIDVNLTNYDPVLFPNPDPLDITVTVSWGTGLEVRSISLTTEMTK